MQNEKTFDTGELTLNYAEGGASDAPPMVLLHGLTSQKLGWYPVFPELAERWHVYAPDFRGHGKSGRPADDHQYHNADYARDVIALLKHLGAPVVLMGHSLGAMVGIVTAWQYPEGVRALVLLEPPLSTYSASVQIQPNVAHWFALVASVNQGSPSHETIVERLRAAVPDAPDEQIGGMAGFVATVASGAPETALRDEIWQGVDLPRALREIRCPTLLIHGDWDAGAAMRTEDLDLFKANLPSAVIVRLPGADHGLKMQEQPEIVLQHVNAFLQSV